MTSAMTLSLFRFKSWTGALASLFAPRARPQMAALCHRRGNNGVEILLVTSRNSGRWIIPKGWPIEGLSAPETAAREAFEEAGVIGDVARQPLGSYGYIKHMGKGLRIACRVSVFALKLDHQADEFPEQGQRRTNWLNPDAAADLVDQPALAEILRNFAK
jgi:8-oxo-dGTP pyrophosphatase MutT (NUDIX family)